MTVTTSNCVGKPAEYINMVHAKIKLHAASLTTQRLTQQ